MAIVDPYLGFEDDEAALETAVLGYFETLSRAAPGKIQAAIRTGVVGPLVNSKQWGLGNAEFTTSLTKIQGGLVEAGMRQAVNESPRPFPFFTPRIGELAGIQGGERAADLAKAIDDRTRAGIRATIGRAAREYAANPTPTVLRRLQGEIRSVIGLTPKQASRIDDWRRTALAAGVAPEAVSAGVAARAAAGKDLRAKAIADRGIIEAIASGRHSAWTEARAAGDLPKNTMKQWRDQGDRHVRPLHRAQSQQGPILLDSVYEIQGVQHPPSPDPGCRCWETLYIPPEGEDEVVSVPQEEEPEPTVEDVSDFIAGEFASIEAAIAEETAQVEAAIADVFDARADIRAAIEDPLSALDDVVRGLSPEVQQIIADARVADLRVDLAGNVAREAELRGQQRALGERGRALAHAVIKTGEPSAFKPAVEFLSRLTPSRRATIQEGLDWLASVLSKDPRAEERLAVWTTARSRSYQAGSGIFMSKRADVGTVIHELGHWFERDPEVLARSAEFLASRTAGESAEKLSKLFPGYGYRSDEVTLKDKFAQAYTGKLYRSGGAVTATEILSMGLENMFRDPLGFAREDQGFFNFVLSFLKGFW